MYKRRNNKKIKFIGPFLFKPSISFLVRFQESIESIVEVILWLWPKNKQLNSYVCIWPPLLRNAFMFSPIKRGLISITVAAWSVAWALFARSNTEVVDSNPIWGINICVGIYSVFVLSCVYVAALRRAGPPVQRVLPTVYRNWKSDQGSI
jgi:hypothetical protein